MSTYPMRARCGNCGKEEIIRIPEGTLADDWRKTAECSSCKVKGRLTLRQMQ